MKLGRRSFLRGSLATSAVFAASSVLPGALGCRSSKPRRRADFGSIAHVVIFMQENRSYDSYFGTLAGTHGFGDRHPLSLASGGSVFGQPSGSASTFPYRLDSITRAGQCADDLAHDYFTGKLALDGGIDDGWVNAKGLGALGYYTREDIPFHYALADAFTTCDHYFCSTNTSTNPNRLFLWTGTVDAGARHEGPILDNGKPSPFTWTTYPERLERAGISWRVYQEIDNYDDNALAWFQTFQDAPAGSSLYENGMARRSRTAFVDDVANDALPAVSWIVAPAELSEHPPYAPNKGADLARLYLEALASNPAVWEKTVFLYTMDENGGFFDHVVPPTPPPGTPDEFVGADPVGFGIRVPTIAISPFSTGGFVCSEVFDHTSILRFLELFTGVDEPNISAWRRKVSGDLTSAFDFRASAAAFPIALPDTAALVTEADATCALADPAPAGETSPPVPESGSKALRRLPYQASAELEVDAARSIVRVRVGNRGTRAIVVSVHGLAGVDATPAFVTVDPGKNGVAELAATPGGAPFTIEVHGPGGFHRRFVGSTIAGALAPISSLTVDEAGGTATLTVKNTDASSMDVAFTDAFGASSTASIASGQSKSFVLATRDRWYDASFTILGVDPASFRRTYAGHVEGAESRTLG